MFTSIRLQSCLSLLSLLMVCPVAKAQEDPAPKRVVVPQLAGKVSVDGNLNESVWRSAVEIGPFVLNSGKGPASVNTRLKLWFDEEALYLGWSVADKDIQATFTNRDSMFWEEEVVEFFVTPKDLNRYFELQWNPLNGVFDAIITNNIGADGRSKGIQGEWGFTAPHMTSKVQVKGTVQKSSDTDEGWTAEVRIPFKDLSLATPKAGDVWRANFYRFNRDQGKSPELLAWTPTLLPSFHEPSRFGFLEFGKLQK